jgi:thiamine-monophosphate kinase
VPLSEVTRRALVPEPGLLDTILTGGDDYEVLASVAESEIGELTAEAAAVGVTMTEIGTIDGGEGRTRFLGRDGRGANFVRAS